MNVDLVCLIDKSRCLNGEKIKFIKETLLKLVKREGNQRFLTEEDKLYIVLFNN